MCRKPCWLCIASGFRQGGDRSWRVCAHPGESAPARSRAGDSCRERSVLARDRSRDRAAVRGSRAQSVGGSGRFGPSSRGAPSTAASGVNRWVGSQRCPSRLDQPGSDGVAGQGQAVAQPELLQNVRPVPVDGLGADAGPPAPEAQAEESVSGEGSRAMSTLRGHRPPAPPTGPPSRPPRNPIEAAAQFVAPEEPPEEPDG
jgi:hypothetical protein